MDKTHIEDPAASMAGGIRAAVGTLAGDARTQAEELASQAAETAEHVYGQVRDQVRGAGTAAARKAGSYLSIFTAVSMLVGAFIACVAAALGGQQRDEY
jgi:uncharacterized protein YjbJ (UPF0337 family)